jgi:hypothetical protein
MASNGMATQASFAPNEVLEAMLTMRSSDTSRKSKAHEYLESFQKSVRIVLAPQLCYSTPSVGISNSWQANS